MLIFGNTYDGCLKNIKQATSLLSKVGFTVNYEKSQLLPSQRVQYLGFLIDSSNMLIELPQEKQLRISNKCIECLQKDKLSIQILSELIGNMIAAVPACKIGLLYTRQLEIEKIAALRVHNGNYNAKMQLSREAKQDIKWWLKHLPNFRQSLSRKPIDHVVFTDASLIGWGAECSGLEAKGTWPAELNGVAHINLLELYAVFFGLKSLIKENGKHILLRVDNTTSLSYIKRFGGCKSDLHLIAKMIWQWAEASNNYLSATYINTKENITADRLSREHSDSSDFKLSTSYFQKICIKLGHPSIDLIASHITTQCQRFIHTDPIHLLRESTVLVISGSVDHTLFHHSIW